MKRISVIISAHNRKQFLLQALKSVLRQEYPRDHMEILCVKNFIDSSIDSFCAENDIKTSLVGSGPLGEKMAEGIKQSTGDIVTFLDDDDFFEQGKLKRINYFFEKFPDTQYYHNAINRVDENGTGHLTDITKNSDKVYTFRTEQLLDGNLTKIIKSRGDWYASCISVSREVARDCVSYLEKLSASFDKILCLVAFSHQGTVIIDNIKTTNYRMHESLTTVVKDLDQFIIEKTNFYRKSFESFNQLNLDYRSLPLKKIINYYKNRDLLNYYVLQQDPDLIPSDKDISFFFIFSLKHRLYKNLAWIALYKLRGISLTMVKKLYYSFTTGQFKRYMNT